jgi:hypothetical protein
MMVVVQLLLLISLACFKKINGQYSSAFFKITIDTTTNDPNKNANCPILSIAEVNFFKNTIQLSNSLFRVNASSYATVGKPAQANDNNINTHYHSCDSGIQGCNNKNDLHPYLNFTVSDNYPFDLIKIYNRQDSYQNRLVGANVKVYHTSDMNSPLWKTTISSSQMSYTFSSLAIYGKFIN